MRVSENWEPLAMPGVCGDHKSGLWVSGVAV